MTDRHTPPAAGLQDPAPECASVDPIDPIAPLYPVSPVSPVASVTPGAPTTPTTPVTPVTRGTPVAHGGSGASAASPASGRPNDTRCRSSAEAAERIAARRGMTGAELIAQGLATIKEWLGRPIDCLTVGDLEDLAAGEPLPRDLADHVRSCPRCRELVAPGRTGAA